MKIAIVTMKFPPADVGGAEISAYNVARLLAKKHEVHVITRRQHNPQKGDYKVHMCRFIDRTYPLRYLSTAFSLLGKIKEIRPDLIYAETLYSAGFAGALAKRRLKIPLVVRLAGEIYWIKGFLEKRIVKFILRNADNVIALTEHMKREVLRHYPKTNISVIGEGVDLDMIRKARPRDLPKNTVLYLGRFVQMKGPHIMLKAFKRVHEAVPDSHLVMAGYGEDEPSLRHLANELNLKNITWTGKVDPSETASYFKACTVFAVPSLSEGFPLTVAEAMACGCAIVSTNVRGIPEILKDKRNGFLVEADDPEALAERIIHLLKSPEIRKAISQNNLKDAVKHSWENVVECIEKEMEILAQ